MVTPPLPLPRSRTFRISRDIRLSVRILAYSILGLNALIKFIPFNYIVIETLGVQFKPHHATGVKHRG